MLLTCGPSGDSTGSLWPAVDLSWEALPYMVTLLQYPKVIVIKIQENPSDACMIYQYMLTLSTERQREVQTDVCTDIAIP